MSSPNNASPPFHPPRHVDHSAALIGPPRKHIPPPPEAHARARARDEFLAREIPRTHARKRSHTLWNRRTGEREKREGE